MAHLSTRIADLEASLAKLRAEEASENAARGAQRPPGIPPDWVPITFRRGATTHVLVAWADPNFIVEAIAERGTVQQSQPDPGVGPR